MKYSRHFIAHAIARQAASRLASLVLLRVTNISFCVMRIHKGKIMAKIILLLLMLINNEQVERLDLDAQLHYISVHAR